jgi:Domain of Unknown Function with PDB structure (DUF3857)/Transglutaminase-like superfamily
MNKLFSKSPTKALILACFCCLIAAAPARAGDSAPDWLRQLAHAPLGKYPEEANGVVLLDDETLTVKDNGEMFITSRRALKILRPSGKELGIFHAYYDKDTKLESMRAWSITATGQEYELKDKDGIETSPYDGEIYQDIRYKLMKLPGADTGAYVAVEYTQRCRPYAFSHRWDFQRDIPVKTARFTLNIPSSWEYQYSFGNWSEQKPQSLGANSWRWEVNDVDGIFEEPDMPPAESLAGRMVVSLYSASLTQASRIATWSDVAAWGNSLNASRRVATPKMQEKIAQLTAGKADTLSKIHALASYAQHNIRYVAINIGIGGYQAHMAGDTFANSYGDCKDKATLLVTMLHEIGVDAYLSLVDADRGVVNPSVPTPWTFNHAIVAIKLPKDVDPITLYASVDDPKLGKLLFFDPTSEMTPFGLLPAGEQNSYALVITGNGGALLKMPMVAPPINRLLRVAHLQITPEGALFGEVEEIRSGHEASALRRELLSANRDNRAKYLERFLAQFLDRSRLTYASITGLDKYDDPLILRYKFEAYDYAKLAGDLMLVRPRVIGVKSSPIAENKKRKYPVEYATTSLQSDVIDIKLPAGYTVDELPTSADVQTPFAEYKSKVESKDNVLYYNRSYTVKDLLVPIDKMGELRTFMRGVAQDERNTAVLKKAPTT